MSLSDNISMELDGELVDADPIGITCDFCPGTTVIDPAEPVQFEVIRFDDPAASRGVFALPQTWTLDAVRCSWHADAHLPHATRGVDEALATVVVDAVDEFDYRVRGESLTLVDYSPTDQGRDAPRSSGSDDRNRRAKGRFRHLSPLAGGYVYRRASCGR